MRLITPTDVYYSIITQRVFSLPGRQTCEVGTHTRYALPGTTERQRDRESERESERARERKCKERTEEGKKKVPFSASRPTGRTELVSLTYGVGIILIQCPP